MKNRRLKLIFAAIAVILCTPLIAMQFTTEVNWTLSDFVVMAVLLVGTGLVIEFILRKVRKPMARLILCGVVLLLLMLTWAEMAVGIFDSPIAGN